MTFYFLIDSKFLTIKKYELLKEQIEKRNGIADKITGNTLNLSESNYLITSIELKIQVKKFIFLLK